MAKSPRRGDVGLSASHSSGSKSRHWLDCLKRVCRKTWEQEESLEYARHATAVAPSSFAAWLQLSREEGISGNKQAASKALARANQLRCTAGKSSPRDRKSTRLNSSHLGI